VFSNLKAKYEKQKERNAEKAAIESSSNVIDFKMNEKLGKVRTSHLAPKHTIPTH